MISKSGESEIREKDLEGELKMVDGGGSELTSAQKGSLFYLLSEGENQPPTVKGVKSFHSIRYDLERDRNKRLTEELDILEETRENTSSYNALSKLILDLQIYRAKKKVQKSDRDLKYHWKRF